LSASPGAVQTTEVRHRSHSVGGASLDGMTTNLVEGAYGRSLLLELLDLAGWQPEVRDGKVPTVRTTRAGIELEVSGASLPDTAGSVFAPAMRSRRRHPEG
jgi:hypothetical protein